jgi:acetyl-CoA carboxylase biotin carboxylase subunit
VPEGLGVRVDSGIYEGFEVAPFYDPLLLKLTVWGHDRAHALRRMRRALGELHIGGLRDNAAFLRRVIDHPDFVSGDYDIGFVDRQLEALLARPEDDGQLSRIAELAGLVAAYDRDEARRRGLDGSAAPKERVVSLWRQMGRWRQIRNR